MRKEKNVVLMEKETEEVWVRRVIRDQVAVIILRSLLNED